MRYRNDTSITVSAVEPVDRVQKPLYKLKVEGEGSDRVKTSCIQKVCKASGLKPGRPYTLSTQSCYKMDPAMCDKLSPAATISTVPLGELASLLSERLNFFCQPTFL